MVDPSMFSPAPAVTAGWLCLEHELQADLRHRFGTASDSWFEELWEFVYIEAGVAGL